MNLLQQYSRRFLHYLNGIEKLHLSTLKEAEQERVHLISYSVIRSKKDSPYHKGPKSPIRFGARALSPLAFGFVWIIDRR